MSLPDCGISWSDALVITFFACKFPVIVHSPMNVMFYSSFKNPFLASGEFCHLLITFANSLDQDQDRLIQAV